MKTIKFDMHFILQLVASFYYIWMQLTVMIFFKLNLKIEKYTLSFFEFYYLLLLKGNFFQVQPGRNFAKIVSCFTSLD